MGSFATGPFCPPALFALVLKPVSQPFLCPAVAFLLFSRQVESAQNFWGKVQPSLFFRILNYNSVCSMLHISYLSQSGHKKTAASV
jgi:hypothetical protein